MCCYLLLRDPLNIITYTFEKDIFPMLLNQLLNKYHKYFT